MRRRPAPESSDEFEVLRTLTRPCSPRFFPELQVRGARVCADLSPAPAPRWDKAQGRGLRSLPLGWKGIWLPFCGPLTLSAPAERWPKPRFLRLGSGVPGPPSRYWGPSLFRAGWRVGWAPGWHSPRGSHAVGLRGPRGEQEVPSRSVEARGIGLGCHAVRYPQHPPARPPVSRTLLKRGRAVEPLGLKAKGVHLVTQKSVSRPLHLDGSPWPPLHVLCPLLRAFLHVGEN